MGNLAQYYPHNTKATEKQNPQSIAEPITFINDLIPGQAYHSRPCAVPVLALSVITLVIMYDDIYSDSKSPILIITKHQINTIQVVVIREMDGRLEWGNDDTRGFPLFYELIQLIKTHVAS